ncbi:uncharacterized protein LOC122984196 [Thunnus albacares]|uniref:uncharacterized protein LOC122984196 n=1 Tax=Thunnus albacares TaxID=8236 RepID=UPI001CF645E9|nr:uncharacterized protein LOC122984196 [Thunnus albacares]
MWMCPTTNFCVETTAWKDSTILCHTLQVHHVCNVSGWNTMLTEVLCCGQCLKAARSGEGSKMGRWLAWDPAILSQLSNANQAMFPAILTSRRGVDRNVVRLLRDRTEGNTMIKVWRLIRENHVEEYLQRKDLYTTLLMTVAEPKGIVSAFRHTFQPPPSPRELPSVQLLYHAFLLAEADNVQDHRNQILSTFGAVLKMDSTKKVVKKLSGEGKGSAEWFTSIRNEHSQNSCICADQPARSPLRSWNRWPVSGGDFVPALGGQWDGCVSEHLPLNPPV